MKFYLLGDQILQKSNSKFPQQTYFKYSQIGRLCQTLLALRVAGECTKSDGYSGGQTIKLTVKQTNFYGGRTIKLTDKQMDRQKLQIFI